MRRNPYQEKTPGSSSNNKYFYGIRNIKQRFKDIGRILPEIEKYIVSKDRISQIRSILSEDVDHTGGREKHLLRLRRKLNAAQNVLSKLIAIAPSGMEGIEGAKELANKPINTKGQVNTSKYRGVGFEGVKKRWRARLTLPSGEVLNYWAKDEMDACRQYDQWVREHFEGNEMIKRLNFYDGPPPKYDSLDDFGIHEKRSIVRSEVSTEWVREEYDKPPNFLIVEECDEILENQETDLLKYDKDEL